MTAASPAPATRTSVISTDSHPSAASMAAMVSVLSITPMGRATIPSSAKCSSQKAGFPPPSSQKANSSFWSSAVSTMGIFLPPLDLDYTCDWLKRFDSRQPCSRDRRRTASTQGVDSVDALMWSSDRRPPQAVRRSADEGRGEDQRHDRHHLDHDVHGRAGGVLERIAHGVADHRRLVRIGALAAEGDRKSTRLNSSHVKISYAVFCLKKKRS